MVSLPYGSRSIEFDSSGLDYRVIQSKSSKPTVKQVLMVENAFHHAIKHFEEGSLTNLEIAIGINDQSRPIPNQILLPCLLRYLHHRGAQSNMITFYIASGTHVPLNQAEYSKILSPDILSTYKVISHDCDDINELVFLGNTSYGTPVHANRRFMDADIRILVGSIEPHHFMGFSGGVKTAAIGLTGRETITANHALLSHPNSVMGLYTTNLMRQDVEEIGKMMEIHAALNVILNDHQEIIAAFWDNPTDVMEKGIKFIRRNLQLDDKGLTGAFDLVIASPGGYPKDINFYQAQKAITHACLFAKPNGVIILAAECRNGLGSEKFENFIDANGSVDLIISAFESMKFEIGPHKAYMLAKQLKKHPIYLVSDIEESLTRKMHLIPAKTVGQAYELSKMNLPENARIAILPYATHAMPEIKEAANQK